MLKQFVCVLVVVGIAYFQGSNAIKCYLCIGSPTSDCANANKAAMVEQECPEIHWRPHHRHHHRRHHHHHHPDFETTTSVNDIIDNSVESSSERPDLEDFERQVADENNTSTTPNPPRLILTAKCTYLKLKASNRTTSLVARGCGYMTAKKDYCTVWEKINPNLVECKTCDTDDCN